GATGQKLESYSCQYASGSLGATLEGINTYFAGKMLSEKGVFIATDRVGSVRGDSNGVSMSYYPWGEERGQGTADGRTKFAGYYRDMPGQDYAMARYYSASTGSFWSPDPLGTGIAATGFRPSIGAVNLRNPLSWNRYLYAAGDPVNRTDPSGLCYFENGSYYDDDGESCTNSNGDVVADPTSVTVWAGFPTVQPMDGPDALEFAQAMQQKLQGFDAFFITFATQAALSGVFASAQIAELASLSGSSTVILGPGASAAGAGFAEVGGVVGAETLNIPDAVWQALGSAGQKDAMVGLINGALDRGAQIVFSIDPAAAGAGPGVAFEYQYILSLGLKVVQQGTSWVVVP
ncbi:MAG: RHS repeat-associated core domain-containing protein, partial [Bryobacteraceae bacterium]